MRRVNSYTDYYETCVWYNIHRNCFQFRAQLFILHWEGTSYTEKRIFTDSVRKDSVDVCLCGGSVVSNHHVLTAAHCMTKEKDYVIKVKEYKISINNENFKSTGITIHPKYVS